MAKFNLKKKIEDSHEFEIGNSLFKVEFKEKDSFLVYVELQHGLLNHPNMAINQTPTEYYEESKLVATKLIDSVLGENATLTIFEEADDEDVVYDFFTTMDIVKFLIKEIAEINARKLTSYGVK